MHKYTLSLFIFSLLMSFGSFFLIKNGGHELYPFYSWKLFSVPSGNLPNATQLKLYTIGDDERLYRTVYKENSQFDENEANSFTNYFGGKIRAGSQTEIYKDKLLVLGKILYPGAKRFALVEEEYNPQQEPDKKVILKTKIITFLK